ncbi:GMC family oxidoreductase [Paraburkholderia bannensis]|uniref:GMC family oxidoreductase n=1 Tax=Paraburkholderia bannensis TaxID=765414 RepID=UPI002AC34913|nr:GMC family oxidoreductase [Paraburkholderia bannensis]
MHYDFDVIVVGSGISGGWAAKELTEKGLKVALIERGKMIEHQADYHNEMKAPWEMPFRGIGDQKLFNADYKEQQGLFFNEWTQDHWVNDRQNPYESSGPVPFQWRRGYQLGGRSLTWGRHVFRRDDHDFEANLKDGNGSDWPIRYRDIERWYSYVESFIGVSGDASDKVEGLPNGVFQAPFGLTAPELALKKRLAEQYDGRRQLIIGRIAHLREAKEGRAPCQARLICSRGCSYGAYFSTQSSTLPAARATGNLTLLTDQIVERVDYDSTSKRVSGISLLSALDGSRKKLTARAVFLNASAFNSVGILLRSACESFPNGLGNSSGVLGKYVMDHGATTFVARIKGFDDRTYAINRPAAFIIPRYLNVTESQEGLLRGYAFQGGVSRRGYTRGADGPGLGVALKKDLKGVGDWIIFMGGFIETLPRASNAVTLSHAGKDAYGMAQLHINFEFSDNERRLAEHATNEARKFAGLMGWDVLFASPELGRPGSSIHEMGGARMGRDPATSFLNGFNQSHDIPNLFVTDGAAMASSGSVNPSLTYMALTARAADYAVKQMKAGTI